jgi:multiple sugar transport system substrate-binding protein
MLTRRAALCRTLSVPAGALLACRSARLTPDQPVQPAKGPVTLRLHIQDGSYAQWSQKWGERFTREHPQITIVVEPFPTAGQEYHTKIKTMLATQTLGDLVWTWCTQGLLGEFSHLGVWRPLDDLVRADRFDLGQYYPAIIEGMKFRGSLMGLPFHGHPGFPFFFYNIDLFAKHGVALPDERWTLETLADAARRLSVTDPSGAEQYGWFSVAGYHGLIVWARLWGGDLISVDGRKSELASAATRGAIQWIVDARFRHGFEPPPQRLAGRGNVNDLFAGGLFAMMHGDSAQVSTMHHRVRETFRWSVALLPPGPGGARGALATPHIMGITSQCKAVAEAWTFLKSYTSKEAGVDKALDGAGVPGGRPDAWNDPRILAGVPQYTIVARAFEWARPEHAPANFRGLEASSTIDRELQPVFAGTEDVSAGALKASDALQRVLDLPVV